MGSSVEVGVVTGKCAGEKIALGGSCIKLGLPGLRAILPEPEANPFSKGLINAY